MRVRVAINGLGRIGRAVLRQAVSSEDLEVVLVNDINPDIDNIAYLIKYDSTYGRLAQKVVVEGDAIRVGDRQQFRVTHQRAIEDVAWEDAGVDIVIDASGVEANLAGARKLKPRGIRYCVVTNSPAADAVDRTVIIGTNHHEIVPSDFLIASSICDANAFVPAAALLDREWGIDHGFVTTLHPWLNYQNLLDGAPMSYATPGSVHTAYELGRASTLSLIPKTTSAISASCKVLKQVQDKFLAISYRVPSMIVSSCDISVKLSRSTTIADVKEAFEEAQRRQSWNIIWNNKEPLVSVDFAGSDYSCIVDHRWLMLNEQNYLKVILWYDNEWAYSARVVDLARFLANGGEAPGPAA